MSCIKIQKISPNSLLGRFHMEAKLSRIRWDSLANLMILLIWDKPIIIKNIFWVPSFFFFFISLAYFYFEIFNLAKSPPIVEISLKSQTKFFTKQNPSKIFILFPLSSQTRSKFSFSSLSPLRHAQTLTVRSAAGHLDCSSPSPPSHSSLSMRLCSSYCRH